MDLSVQSSGGDSNSSNDPISGNSFDIINLMMRNSNSNLGYHQNQQQQQQQATDNLSFHSHHSHLVSANSFELNAAVSSLSDDSGLPHTNSSISSVDLSRIGVCKFESELVESDGEVSQFDSLENCSDGGMSAENFNTLKKGPLAPIDPPPEFQDSPQTTLLRSPALQSYALRMSKSIIASAINILSTASLSPFNKPFSRCCVDPVGGDGREGAITLVNGRLMHANGGGSVWCKKSYQMYASDSYLNQHHSDNIYDEPHVEPGAVRPVTLVTPKTMEMCNKMKLACEIHDYDMYYSAKKYSDSFHRRKASILYSPLHHHPGSNLSTANRPNSRNSLSSRLSSSHNSLSVPTANKADDSIFITQAMSHDALMGREISDFYNVPIDSDIYALPVDVIRAKDIKAAELKTTKSHRSKLKYVRNNNKKRRRSSNNNAGGAVELVGGGDKYGNKPKTLLLRGGERNDKRHSVPENMVEPLPMVPHMTLDEVKRFYHSLYSSSSDSSELNRINSKDVHKKLINNNNTTKNDRNQNSGGGGGGGGGGHKTLTMLSTKTAINLKNRRSNSNKDAVAAEVANNHHPANNNHTITTSSATMGTQTVKYGATQTGKKSQFSINLKQKFCSIFRFRKQHHHHNAAHQVNNSHPTDAHVNGGGVYGGSGGSVMQQDASTNTTTTVSGKEENKKLKFFSRALPPLPNRNGATPPPIVETTYENSASPKEKDLSGQMSDEQTPTKSATTMDFAANIEKVKEYGWYWGPLSSEAAEKILSNEPDGSFIVRDSSDDHYIFSLTFKLNNCVRHVRIEQDQGTFSFGSCAKFKSRTIMEFIDNAVEHSRSGRYLFFLHRRPEHGPMRVQLTNPVSRFKHIQSLQHLSRFVILKAVVRKDLIQTLPLPRRLLDYLSYKNCYSEQVESDSSHSQLSDDGQVT